MREPLVFLALAVFGAAFIAGPLLAGRFAARGRRRLAALCLLPPLTFGGAGAGLAGGVFLSLFLFGFNMNGRAPWWDRHLPTAGAVWGAITCGVAALWFVRRWSPAADRPAGPAADYDDAAPTPRRPPR